MKMMLEMKMLERVCHHVARLIDRLTKVENCQSRLENRVLEGNQKILVAVILHIYLRVFYN